MSWSRDLLEAIDAPFDRDEPLVLSSRQNHHVCELLEHILDLGDALVDIVQLGPHSIIGTCPCDDKTDGGQDVAVVDRGIEPELRLFVRTLLKQRTTSAD
jgi:hypothetical protein